MFDSSNFKTMLIRLIAAVCIAAAAENLLPKGESGVVNAAKKLISLAVMLALVSPV